MNIFRTLSKFINAVSGTKTTYGVIECRGNKMLDLFPLSVTRDDLGGADGVNGPWLSFFRRPIYLEKMSLFENPTKNIFGVSL